MVRGLVQIIAVGSILVILLRAPRWTSGILLAGMIVAAGATSARRAKGMPDAFRSLRLGDRVRRRLRHCANDVAGRD